MSLQRRAQKYASNRKQEIQLKKELEAVKNKALLEHYSKQRGSLPPLSPPHGKPASTEPQPGHAYIPIPPSQAQPKSLVTSTKTTRRVQITSHQPTSTNLPPAATAAAEHVNKDGGSTKLTTTSSKPLLEKVEPKVGGKGEKGRQKIVVDSSQKVKFAIANSQKTSVQMKYAQRQPIRKELLASDVRSKPTDARKLSSGRHKQEKIERSSQALTDEQESHPLSRPTVTDSRTSYQRYIVSQTTDYMNADSNITTKTANTPAPIVVEPGISATVSRVEDSFDQPSRMDSSTQSYESFQGGDGRSETSASHSHSLLGELERRSDNESYSIPDTSDVGGRMDSAKVSMSQSGRVTIEVDMRFGSIDQHGSEFSEPLDDKSGAFDQSGSQPFLPHEVDRSELEINREERGTNSSIRSNSAVSFGSSDARSSYHESEADYGEDSSTEGEVRHEEYGSGLELHSPNLLLHNTVTVEHASQPCSDSLSRSSISSHLEVDSQPGSEQLSIRGSITGSISRGDVDAKLQVASERDLITMASLHHTREGIPEITATDRVVPVETGSHASLSVDSTTQSHKLSAAIDLNDDAESASSSTLHGSTGTQKLTSPYTRSLSSVGMPLSLPSQVTTSDSQYLTPSHSTTVTSQPRTSFGSIESSVHSIKPSSSHVLGGLRGLLTSSSKADTSSWLLAHHSVSRMKEEEEEERDEEENFVEPVGRESGRDSVNDVESEAAGAEDDSNSILSGNILRTSQSDLPDHSFGSGERSSIRLSSTKSVEIDDNGSQQAHQFQPHESPINIHSDSYPLLMDHEAVTSSSQDVILPEKVAVLTLGRSQSETKMEDAATEDTKQKENKSDTSDFTSTKLAEYLAFSSEPVTLEDIMHISGQAAPVQSRPFSGQPQKQPGPLHQRKEDEARKTDGPQVRFLSTWESSRTGAQPLHRSIHHFCTEPSVPQLPISLQVVSRQAHAKPLDLEDEPSTESEGTARELQNSQAYPPPNTPSTATRIASEAKRQTPALDKDEQKSETIRVDMLPSTGGRPSTVDVKHSSQIDDDDLIKRAKSQLDKELRASAHRETKPSTAKLSEKRVRMKMTEVEMNLGGGEEQITLRGSRMAVAQDPANLLWVPAPPKLSLHPSTVQAHLFPDYHSSTKPTSLWTSLWQRGRGFGLGRATEHEENTQQEEHQKKLLPLSFSSVVDLSKPAQDNSTTVSAQPAIHPSLISEATRTRTPASPTGSITSASEKRSTGTPQQEAPPTMDARRVALARRRHTIFISSDNQNKTIGPVQSDRGGIVKIKAEKSDTSVRKTQSMPQIIEDGSSQGKGIPSVSESGGSGGSKDFSCAMEEVKTLREQLLVFHKQQSEDEFQEELETKKELGSDEEEDGGTDDIQPLEGSMLATSGAFTSRKLQRQAMRAGRRAGGTGRKATGRVRALRRTRSAQIRAQQARETLSQPPRTLTRTTSYPLLKDELINNTIPAPSNDYRRSRRESLPSSLTDVHFQALKHHIETTYPIVSTTHASDMRTSDASYHWALQLWWDRWFPEVLQEYKQIVAAYSVGKNDVHTFGIGEAMSRHFGSTVAAHKVKSNIGQETKEKDTAPSLESATPQLVRLVNIEPLSSLSADQVKQIEAEIMNLTKSMPKCRDGSMRAVLLCRRGALLRKIGRLRDSMSDLKSALSLQPTLSDILWHRHLLHLIQGNEQLALDDLNSLLKCNKKHFGAYRSRMVLLLRRGDTSKAVFNLTQAIALQPKDAEMYFMRAELFEKRGEVESALSDYAKVTELQPKNKEAISRQAMHKFKKGMWGAATQHFNALLQLDPNNTQARIHRAKAQYNLGRYVAALQDLSASIHLDPNGAQAFYHRACLLRKSQPKKALSDLSISLLLDDSATNVSAYIHRGILYTQLNSYNEALSDFEEAIKLHRSLPSPHICAGLIHMLHKKNLPRAVRCFTTAISVDPTCTRAYLCRAEAFKASEMFKRAILDCTRLIHLQPNNPTYYLRMGELYLSLKNYKMAAQLIRTAAKLCHSGFNQSKTQQALVESFLGNHAEGVALLQTMLRSPSVFTLMGKIQFKAKQFEEAANSFKQAITLVERSLQPKYMVTHMSELDLPKSAVSRKVRGDIHFQCGRSLAEGGTMDEAIDEFSEVIKHCPDNAMAYYERGVAKLKAGGGKGIYDLNRSLAIDPNLFQAFLTRAAHYGRTGRHSKAILNCNEAIKLVPNSVRAHLCRGALKYHVKLYSGAIEDLNTAISLDPSHAALAFFNRALCFEATGHLHKALSDYSTVLLLQESGVYSYKVYVNRGLLYLRLKDFANALLDFLEAKKVWVSGSNGGQEVERKTDPAIHQAIGYCHHQLGSLESAIEAYSLAIDQDPSFLEAYVGRGNVYMDFLSEEGFAKSKEDYVRVLELNASYLPARVNFSFLLQAEGRYKQAWDELTFVLKEDSSFAPALEARSIISLQMDNTFGALLDINNALKLVQSAALLTNRGVIHQFMGDVVNAMRDYQSAVAMEPDYFLAHFNIGNVLFQQRHFRQAITSYTKALSSCQDDAVLLNRAIAYSILQETEKALMDFDLAIELNPYSAPSYFNRGNLHCSLGNHSTAEQDYKKALELQPGDWLTMYYYGEVVGKQRRMDESRDIFRLAAQTEIP